MYAILLSCLLAATPLDDKGKFVADKEPAIEGSYQCKGENPGGNEYKGKVEIKKKGDTYLINWELDSGEKYEGTGILTGDVLSVAWSAGGATGVVSYKVEKSGKLAGKWSSLDGSGKVMKEDLTPVK
jgi:hypothetical protein